MTDDLFSAPPYFDAVCSVDFETYYEKSAHRGDTSFCSLRNKALGMTDYVRHPKFKAHTVALRHSDWDRAVAVSAKNIRDALMSIDWTRTAFLGHHTQFDGFIAAEKYDIRASFYLDTLSMWRQLMGVDTSGRLDDVAKALGLAGKVHGAALDDAVGVVNPSGDLLKRLLTYNRDDAHDTFEIYKLIRPFFTMDHLRIINMTMQMYCRPLLRFDTKMLDALYREETHRRQGKVDKTGHDAKIFGSTEQFAELLKSLGVEPPTKTNPKGKTIYAFAKNDFAFKEMLHHENPAVVDAVAARFATKSNLIENRSYRLLQRAKTNMPQPVYLGYWAARTGRWGGGDSVNLQNLPRRGEGAKLRHAIRAPKGHLLVISDASQIEARMLAWQAGHAEKLAVFASGQDVYSHTASIIYNRHIDKDRDPDERFVGKVLELGAGYGAGAVKMRHMFMIGQFGPPVFMELDEVKGHLNTWRYRANKPIVDLWQMYNEDLIAAFYNETTIERGCVVFEGRNGTGYIHGPDGSFMKYPEIHASSDGGLAYNSRNGTVRFWGGIIAENITQWLSGMLLKQQMLKIEEEMPDAPIVTTTHDEVVLCAPERKAEEYERRVRAIMSETRDWCRGVPLSADTKVSPLYNKG